MTHRRFVPTDERFHMATTLGLLQHGPYDPTTRAGASVAWRTTRTADGPATMLFERRDGGVDVSAWGPGAEHALSVADRLLGALDRPQSYRPKHPLLRDLARRFGGVRLPTTGSILDSLIPSITEQKVTSQEAWRAYAGLAKQFGAPAPQPDVAGVAIPRLRLSPDPALVAASGYSVVHRFGLERRRADVVRRACARAARLEEAAAMTPADARARLQAIPGIGAWTAAEVTRVSHGDADAVSVGDFHTPHTVAWALAGEARGTDERMLELLAGEEGHRGRAILYLELAGFRAPAFGPRQRRRSIAGI